MFNRATVSIAIICMITAACNGSDDDSGAMNKVDVPLTTAFSVKDKFGQVSDTFIVDETMTFELTVTNTSDATATYRLTYPGHEISVMSGDVVVWSKYHGQAFPQVVQSDTLDAHETLNLGVTWNGVDNQGNPVPPGVYEVVPDVSFWIDDVRVPQPEPVTITIR